MVKAVGAWSVVLWLALAPASPVEGAAGQLLVAAAASLTDALGEIGREYEKVSPNRLMFNFGASSSLARQIAEGAPVDLFFSADLQTIERLDRQGLLEEGSRHELLSNQLVVVVPRDSRLIVGSAKDLLQREIRRIALAEPSSVPVGIYARQYLEGESMWQRVRTKVIPVLDARAALAAVESGNVEAGIVYRTDAAISRRVKVSYAVTLERGPRILYVVAIIKNSPNKEAARDLSRFARGENARRIFARHGFIGLP
jgi:molybdate transport system substrate-binding protein